MVFVTLAFKDHVTGKNTNKQKTFHLKYSATVFFPVNLPSL